MRWNLPRTSGVRRSARRACFGWAIALALIVTAAGAAIDSEQLPVDPNAPPDIQRQQLEENYRRDHETKLSVARQDAERVQAIKRAHVSRTRLDPALAQRMAERRRARLQLNTTATAQPQSTWLQVWIPITILVLIGCWGVWLWRRFYAPAGRE